MLDAAAAVGRGVKSDPTRPIVRDPEVLVLLSLVAVAALAQTSIPQPVLEVDPPDDTTAVLLSATVGFGAGHYYAGQPRTGGQHALVQAVGALGLGTGAGLLFATVSGPARDHEAIEFIAPDVVLGFGAILFLGDRLVDIATAPRSVRRTRAAMGH